MCWLISVLILLVDFECVVGTYTPFECCWQNDSTFEFVYENRKLEKHKTKVVTLKWVPHASAYGDEGDTVSLLYDGTNWLITSKNINTISCNYCYY